MIKTKWQKKFEEVVKLVEFSRDFHNKQIEMYPNNLDMLTYNKIRSDIYNELLQHIKQIEES